MSVDLNTTADGGENIKSVRVKMKLQLSHRLNMYGLVIGGIFPVSLLTSERILIDRNVLAVLHHVDESTYRQDSEDNKGWFGYLNQAGRTLNPIMCAMEGANRRVPSFDEFVDSYKQASLNLNHYLPQASVVAYTEEAFDAAYQIVQSVQRRNARESAFLIEACPLVAERKPDRQLASFEEEILSMCGRLALSPLSLPVLSILACLYESKHGEEPLIGRNVLKPRTGYSEPSAHNALSDLHALELLSMMNGLGIGSAAYCTKDRYLAALWQVLHLKAARPHSEDSSQYDLNFSITSELFPRLSPTEFNNLFDRLQEFG